METAQFRRRSFPVSSPRITGVLQVAVSLLAIVLGHSGCSRKPADGEIAHLDAKVDNSLDEAADPQQAEKPREDPAKISFPSISYGIILREASPEGKLLTAMRVTDGIGNTKVNLSADQLKDLVDCSDSDLAPLNPAEMPLQVQLKFEDKSDQRDLKEGMSAIRITADSCKPLTLQLDDSLKNNKAIDLKPTQVFFTDFRLANNEGKPVLRGTVFFIKKSELVKPAAGLPKPAVPIPNITPATRFDFTKKVEIPAARDPIPEGDLVSPKEQPEPEGHEFATRLKAFERGIKRVKQDRNGLEEKFAPTQSGYSSDGETGQFYTIVSGAAQTNSFLKEIVTFNATVFPGAILNGKKLTDPNNASLSVDVQSFGPDSRESLTYATDIGINLGKIGFDPDDQNEFNSKVLDNVRKADVAAPGNFDLTFTTFNSERHLKTKLGIQAEGFGFRGEFESSNISKDFKSAVVVLMRQRMFDISITNPPISFQNWFKRRQFHDDDGPKFQDCCPLLYVDRVYYGKLAMLVVVGKGSAREVATAVKAAYRRFGVEVAGQFTQEDERRADSLEGSLFVHGGDPKIAQDIQANLGRAAGDRIVGTLQQLLPTVLRYFAPDAGISSAQPIGFTARYLYDNNPAVCIAATDSEMCILTPIQIKYWIILHKLVLRNRGTSGFLFIQPPGEWHIGFRPQGRSWKETGCMDLYEGDHPLNWPLEFSSLSGNEKLEYLFAESDWSNDREYIGQSEPKRWDSEVSSGLREMTLNFRQFIEQGDPVDSNGNPLADRAAASYRQKDYTIEAPSKNSLSFSIRVQVPEAMKGDAQTQANKQSKEVSQEVPRAQIPKQP